MVKMKMFLHIISISTNLSKSMERNNVYLTQDIKPQLVSQLVIAKIATKQGLHNLRLRRLHNTAWCYYELIMQDDSNQQNVRLQNTKVQFKMELPSSTLKERGVVLFSSEYNIDYIMHLQNRYGKQKYRF